MPGQEEWGSSTQVHSPQLSTWRENMDPSMGYSQLLGQWSPSFWEEVLPSLPLHPPRAGMSATPSPLNGRHKGSCMRVGKDGGYMACQRTKRENDLGKVLLQWTRPNFVPLQIPGRLASSIFCLVLSSAGRSGARCLRTSSYCSPGERAGNLER